MTDKNEKRNKHLTIEDRNVIQQCLDCGMTFKGIGRRIGKDQTTISKEVKKHLEVRPANSQRVDALGNILPKEVCPRHLKTPFCCNPCEKRHGSCLYQKQYYNAVLAQKAYESLLVEARYGIAFYEAQLQNIFIGFINSLITDRNSFISAYKDVISTLTDNTTLEAERDMLQNECEILQELMRKMVQENARTTQDQTDYQQRYNLKVERYDTAKTRLYEVCEMITSRNAKRLELQRFIKLLKKKDDLLTEFDEDLWLTVVHQMKVHSATEFTFVLKDGMEMAWTI